jgi:TfoX/Sxy family transcriptional regulator of competence genes
VTDDEMVEALLARLSGLGVTTRKSFGSRFLYCEGRFFGFVSDRRLYFHTDAANRPDYLARGMPAFQPKGRPRGPRTVGRNFEVPAEVLSDDERLIAWALRAIAAARP